MQKTQANKSDQQINVYRISEIDPKREFGDIRTKTHTYTKQEIEDGL